MNLRAGLLFLLLLVSSLSGCMGPVDEDVDGVSDVLDLCTLTPIGEVVDENGSRGIYYCFN